LDVFERAQRRRVPGTSEWFMVEPALKCWRDRISEKRSSEKSNIVLIEGSRTTDQPFLYGLCG